MDHQQTEVIFDNALLLGGREIRVATTLEATMPNGKKSISLPFQGTKSVMNAEFGLHC